MIRRLHLAAQYLSAAGISFLDKRKDDSHTNMGWSVETHSLRTWVFHSKYQLGLSFEDYALEWLISGDVEEEFSLKGKSHKEVLDWVKAKTEGVGLKGYKYEFHYELPYGTITEDFIFDITDEKELMEICDRNDLAQIGFETLLRENNLSSNIRVWPHHFDLAIFTEADTYSSLQLGAGLAIPDSLVEEYYFYVSGWDMGESVGTDGFEDLSFGDWYTEEFKGAILRSAAVDAFELNEFLKEVFWVYKLALVSAKN